MIRQISPLERFYEEMHSFIEVRTNGRVADLSVLPEAGRTRVAGRTPSWHVRQLAERAALDFLSQSGSADDRQHPVVFRFAWCGRNGSRNPRAGLFKRATGHIDQRSL